MNRLKPLEGKIFRIAIDGVNYASTIELNDDQKYQIEQLIEEKKNIVLKVFDFKLSQLFPDKNGIIIDSTRQNGIYIKIQKQTSNLSIQIQFKGYFFTKDEPWLNMKVLMLNLMKEIKLFFRVTLIDIAQDVSLKTYEVLPFPTEGNIKNGLKYNFKNTSKHYFDNSEQFKTTGFELVSSRFKLKVYDKKFENSKSKNPDKKHYYDGLFYNHEDVTRVELTLRRESLKRFWGPIFSSQLPVQEFCLQILDYYGSKHSARIRPKNSKDKDISRWPILENWKYLFNRSKNKKIELDNYNQDVFLKSNKTLQKVIYDFAEIIFNEKSVTFSEWIDLAKPIYKEALKINELKKERKKNTKDQLDSLLAEVLAMDFEELGIFITSPGSSMINQKSDIYNASGDNYVQ